MVDWIGIAYKDLREAVAVEVGAEPLEDAGDQRRQALHLCKKIEKCVWFVGRATVQHYLLATNENTVQKPARF